MCGVAIFRLGPFMDGIYVQRTHYNKFVESGSKSWVLMRQRLMQRLGMIK